VQRHERGIVGAERRQVLDLPHHSLEMALVVDVVQRHAALLAVQQQLHAAQPALNLADLGDRPGRVQHARSDVIDVLAL